MNNAKKTDKKVITMACTLTTGKQFSNRINKVREYHYLLVKLLQQYEHMYKSFHFSCEIFDKGYRETKIHYHGLIEVYPKQMYEYSHFISEWEAGSKAPMSDSKIVYDDKWKEYILKQSEISECYKHLGIPQFIQPKDLKKIRKWAQPDDNKKKGIMNLLERMEEGRA